MKLGQKIKILRYQNFVYIYGSMKTFLCTLACIIVSVCSPSPAITLPEDEEWRKRLVGPWTYRNRKRKKNHPFDQAERLEDVLLKLAPRAGPVSVFDLTVSIPADDLWVKPQPTFLRQEMRSKFPSKTRD